MDYGNGKTKNRFKDIESGEEEVLKKENDNLLNELKNSLSSIKKASRLMKDKLTKSNEDLGEVEKTYNNSLGIMKKIFSSFSEILNSGTSIYLYLFLFILTVLAFVFIKTVLF